MSTTPTYYVDLGFDWNAIPASNGTCYLQWGAVNMQPATPVLGDLKDLKPGQTVWFNIYDVSKISGGQSSPAGTVPVIDSNWLTSVVATGTTAANTAGFSNMNDIAAATVGHAFTGTSVYFGQPSPGWMVFSNGSPLSAVVQDPNTNSQTASYLLTWTIRVTSPNAPDKIFTVDPEMIVNPGN